nr:MAG TPA: hypothetical protein [Bacteriophage sp.]
MCVIHNAQIHRVLCALFWLLFHLVSSVYVRYTLVTSKR